MNHRFADCQNSDPDDGGDCPCMGTRSDLIREIHGLEAEKERLERENERLREFVEHVASQRTIMVGNGYSSMARKALGEADR